MTVDTDSDTSARRRHRERYWRQRSRGQGACRCCGNPHPPGDDVEIHHRDGNPRNPDPDNHEAVGERCHHRRLHERSRDNLPDRGRNHSLGPRRGPRTPQV